MIPIKNIYYMLSYVFKILNQEGYKKISTEKFDNVFELLSSILCKGISIQIKRGLNSEYILHDDTISNIRGKIDISKSIKNKSIIKKKLVCVYDEFSINSYLNRIIKTTINLLIYSDISDIRKKELRKLLFYFKDVEILNINYINWNINYNRNNKTYEMLIYICYMIIKSFLHNTSDEKFKIIDFFDEEYMWKIYEKFIFEYYRKEHKQLKVTSSQIPWNLDNEKSEFLPKMKSDVMLYYNNKTLIIDTKYYSHIFQNNYNVNTINSSNLYQIYTYVKNLDKYNTGHVSGLILYAKTDDTIFPNNEYKMGGNRIYVNTLDLNCDFKDIRFQLDEIVFKNFNL